MKSGKSISAIVICMVLLCGMNLVYAADTMSTQGVLIGKNGLPLPSGLYNMQFELYNVATEGTALWQETRTGLDAVSITKGRYAVELGRITPFPPKLFSNYPDLWLEMAVDRKNLIPTEIGCYASSGMLIKTLRYSKIEDFGEGVVRPSVLQTDSPLQKGYRSIMLFSKLEARKFADEVFTLNHLPRVNELR